MARRQRRRIRRSARHGGLQAVLKAVAVAASSFCCCCLSPSPQKTTVFEGSTPHAVNDEGELAVISEEGAMGQIVARTNRRRSIPWNPYLDSTSRRDYSGRSSAPASRASMDSAQCSMKSASTGVPFHSRAPRSWQVSGRFEKTGSTEAPISSRCRSLRRRR